jgi:hypothetical protein
MYAMPRVMVLMHSTLVWKIFLETFTENTKSHLCTEYIKPIFNLANEKPNRNRNFSVEQANIEKSFIKSAQKKLFDLFNCPRVTIRVGCSLE